MARPPKKARLVEGLDGSEEAKRRLRVILQTITEEMTALEAREVLGISESRFHQLREEALEGALASLESSQRGRPPKPRPVNEEEMERLRQEKQALERELMWERTRFELINMVPYFEYKKNEEEPEPPSEGSPGAKRKKKR